MAKMDRGPALRSENVLCIRNASIVQYVPAHVRLSRFVLLSFKLLHVSLGWKHTKAWGNSGVCALGLLRESSNAPTPPMISMT